MGKSKTVFVFFLFFSFLLFVPFLQHSFTLTLTE